MGSQSRRLPMVQQVIIRAALAGGALVDQVAAFRVEKLRAHGHTVPCGEGCSACCYLPVDVTLAEMWLIIETMRDWTRARQDEVFARLDALLERAQQKGVRVQQTDQNSYVAAHLACPFLDQTTQGCGIYGERPYSCREWYIVDEDPTACASLNAEAAVKYLDMEDVDQGAMTTFGNVYRAELKETPSPLWGGVQLLPVMLAAARVAVYHPEMTPRQWMARIKFGSPKRVLRGRR